MADDEEDAQAWMLKNPETVIEQELDSEELRTPVDRRFKPYD